MSKVAGFSRLVALVMASPVRGLLQLAFPHLNRRARLRAAWGRAGRSDAAHARRYFDLAQAGDPPPAGGLPAPGVDERTWNDLELPRLFSELDTTLTLIGRQCLYKQLRTYELDPDLMSRRYPSYRVLQSNSGLREALQLALVRLEAESTAYIVDLLLGPAPQRPEHSEWVLPWVLLTVLAIVAAVAHVVSPWVPMGFLAINGIISIRVDRGLIRAADSLLDCGRLLRAADRLAAAGSQGRLPELEWLAAQAPLRRQLWSQVRWVALLERLRNQGSTDPGNPVNLIGGFVTLLGGLFLIKLLIYVWAIGRFTSSRRQWLSVFDRVGSIDASMAVAGFLLRYPAHAQPEVLDQPLIRIENGYHPLIARPVKSSIVLDGRSALITGSNMTGKTTFIKMIAVNVVLAHTLGFCLADRAVIPRSGVRALIRADQSVESGRSRYFAEAEAILSFLREAREGGCRIFVIDEPFSGTNVTERIAVAKAVLRAIGARAQALVATHDVELQQLLGEGFELFHFCEDPAVEGFFDHRLHAGASTQRNAIRVLERLGFPPEIIAEALATVPIIGNLRA